MHACARVVAPGGMRDSRPHMYVRIGLPVIGVVDIEAHSVDEPSREGCEHHAPYVAPYPAWRRTGQRQH